MKHKNMARANRRANNLRIAANRRALMAALEGVRDRYLEGEAEPVSDNELAVKHPLDCGKRCFMCSGEKLLESNARRAREKRAAMTLEDSAYA